MKLVVILFIISNFVAAGNSDKPLTIVRAQKLLSTDYHFPVVMNESVLRQLNHFIDSSGNHFKICLSRKSHHDRILHRIFRKQQLPEELAAIPIIESCYKDKAFTSKKGPRGMWMLTRGTARGLGLKVDAESDERTDVAKSTQAALKYFRKNLKLFKDPTLALLAYNAGDGALKRAIKKYHTHDPWILSGKKLGGDPDYLSKVIAAMIILRHPELLN
jgi:membrane-bound lytic murein transglycosylase D